MSTDRGIVKGQITDEGIAQMRQRIGYPNPTLRAGLNLGPYNRTASADAIRRWVLGIGDDNPLYCDPAYAAASRWRTPIAPPGFEMSMGWDRSPQPPEDLARATQKALRGVHLFNSGAQHRYYRPIRPDDELFRSEWVASVEEKQSRFATRSVLVTNDHQVWNQRGEVVLDGAKWYIHTERKQASREEGKYAKDEPASYTDEQLREIEDAYDNQYLRGADTLFIEDCEIGQRLPRMVKGPLTITDLINFHMGAGWLTYGNWPYRLAYEGRKSIRGFYTRNEFNAWDTLQRIHWDSELARRVGVQMSYDIGPMRFAMLTHYLTNFAGDDAWIYFVRSEYRNFNYMGDTTWLDGTIVDVKIDEKLGPLIEIDVVGTNQRGAENLRGRGVILVASRAHGLAQLPPPPPLTEHRHG
ncbi:MAG: MaoC family dehydratase N-terminal domain-containing protein [Hyphomonadaceae bacterium]|nr:MaoC family dehydratase N-terminal domain-containing protein [Hyphomonadaceae bacterium]GIK50923.1 MAG: acyl dehydratase [Alphaproteobacteria bacterium]